MYHTDDIISIESKQFCPWTPDIYITIVTLSDGKAIFSTSDYPYPGWWQNARIG